MNIRKYLSEETVKAPKGYKVTVKKIKINSSDYMYDCTVWKGGVVIIRTSQSLFNYRDEAKDYGIYLARINAGLEPLPKGM